MRRIVLLGCVPIAVAAVAVAASAAPIYAQEQPPLPIDLGKLISNPAQVVTDVFNAALVGIARSTTQELMRFVGEILDSAVISSTPPNLSYENASVRSLWDTVRLAANGALGVVTVWGGYNLVVGPHIRAPYHGALELIPRVLLGALLVNTSFEWGKLVINANNFLCAWVSAPGKPPGWAAVENGEASGILVYLLACGIYLLMGLLLAGQMLMRLALVDVLLVLAPVALVCWVLPQTMSWARLWFTTFFGTVFVQFVQVVVLRLGTDLTTGLVSMIPGVAADPIGGGGSWLATLTLGIAVLQLTRKVPRLMPGYPGANDAWGPMRLFTMRQMSSVLGGDRGRPRQGGAR